VAGISLHHVYKTYPNGGVATRDLTLEIADGELLVIVGPSGSGKSTVLRLIAGLEAPSAGRIVIGGRDVTEVSPQERDLAMVFQSYALYPHKTVRDNLAFGLCVRRVPDAEIKIRVNKVAGLLGIEQLLDRRPAQLSGGQRQRVALGRAIVREPQAFLLDEPLSNLDPLLRVGTRTELVLLHRRLGTTMVYVTHDQEEAMTLGTRIAVMRDGALEQLDAPLAVYRHPANRFVAGFVGSPAMNVWRCTVARAQGQLRVRSAAFSLDIDSHGVAEIGSGTVVCGVRPHDIDLVSGAEADARGQVAVVEPLGAATLIHVRCQAPSVDLVRIVVGSDARLAVDDEVGFRLRRDRVHLFDAQTGRRLD
jgi:multiple sugar transport system ATP-binding protein